MDNSVGIIMPAYNAGSYIKSSIESVLAQSHSNWNLYIIDDASTDNTREIVLSFLDPRIIYKRQSKNLGVAMTRNVGIDLSSEKYLAFLDSDDIWMPKKLEMQIKFLEAGYDVVCSNYMIFEDDFDRNKGVRTFSELISISDMLKSNKIGNLTGIYNQFNLGKFYQESIGHEDYFMWLKIISKAKLAYCVQMPLARYRLSPNSLSGNKLKAAFWQWLIYRKYLNLSIFKSLYFFLFYIYNSLSRKNR